MLVSLVCLYESFNLLAFREVYSITDSSIHSISIYISDFCTKNDEETFKSNYYHVGIFKRFVFFLTLVVMCPENFKIICTVTLT